MPDKRTILKGNGIGDYVSIGDSFLYLNSLITPMYNIEKEDVEEEYIRLDKAIEQSKNQIEYLINNVDNKLKNILSMHILLIQDPVIIKQVKDEVKEKLLNVELFDYNDGDDLSEDIFQYYEVKWKFESLRKYDGRTISLNRNGDVEIYDDDGNVEKSFNLGQLKEFVNQLK